jgi:hypothetical protein
MPVQCPSCKLLFGTSNELDWHAREEHMQPSLPVRTPHADDITTPVGRTEPVTVGPARAGPDSPPAPDPSKPSEASSAPSRPLAWFRRWLRPSQAAGNRPGE